MNVQKTEESVKMALKGQYESLSEMKRVSVREQFLAESGLSLPAFYYKLRDDKFRPLERKLFTGLLKKALN